MATATRIHHLPPETLCEVMSFLPQAVLKNLRLVDHRFSLLATRRLFRRTRLLARAKENNDPQRFIQLANSALSGFVREVSCDVSSIVHNGLYYMEEDQFEFLPVFWDALPLLARFRNIQTLHLCFDLSFTLQDFKEDPNHFRSRVLKTVFRILMGTFTKEVSKIIDTRSGATMEIRHQGSLPSPIILSTLIISNLGDFHDPGLTNMPEFKTAMGNIKALRLDIAQHKERWGGAWSFTETTAIPNQCQEMFTQLPLTWLSSTVAANLQVLSLHYQSYWGWFPNLDIRLVGGGNGMPKLRSLALGHFVFSHQREVDWITSLDLEELFLEGCAILTKHISHPTTQKGLWTDDHELTATAKIGGEGERIYLWWHEIIWQIRTSMLNLKRFCIVGQPDLTYHYLQFRKIERLRDHELSSDEELSQELRLLEQYVSFNIKNIRSCETAFQHFTCATSPKLRLDSDIFRCSHFDPLTSITLDSSSYSYVSHGPTYAEQASYKREFREAEAAPVLGSMGELAKAEVIILHSMLSKKSEKQHMGAEKLRLAPKMESRDANAYIEAVLRPLFTIRERSHLQVMFEAFRHRMNPSNTFL